MKQLSKWGARKDAASRFHFLFGNSNGKDLTKYADNIEPGRPHPVELEEEKQEVDFGNYKIPKNKKLMLTCLNFKNCYANSDLLNI